MTVKYADKQVLDTLTPIHNLQNRVLQKIFKKRFDPTNNELYQDLKILKKFFDLVRLQNENLEKSFVGLKYCGHNHS